MVLKRYFLSIPQGIKFQFGAFLLIYVFEIVLRLIFVFFSFELHTVPYVMYHSTILGFPLDLSITGYLMIFLNIVLEIRKFGVSKKLKWPWIQWVCLKSYTWAISLVFMLHVIILITDIFLFHYWQWRINSQAIMYLSNWKIILKTLPSFVFVGIALILGVILFVIFHRPRISPIVLTEKKTQLSVFNLCLLLLYFVFARGGISDTPINLGSVLKEGSLSVKVSSINGVWNALNSLSNTTSLFSINKLLVDEKNEEEAYKRYNPNYHWSDSLISTKVKSFWLNDYNSKPNVHLIILEGINQHWLERKNTPLIQLKKLSANFLSFSKCYAVGDRTDKGLASVVTGWSGEPGPGIMFSPDRWNNLQGLPNILKSSNYTSEFWYGGDNDFANYGAFLKTMGYNNLYDINFIDDVNINNDQNNNNTSTSLTHPKKIKWGYSDISTAEFIINSNQKNKQLGFSKTSATRPLFRTWLTLSTHEPFDIVGDFARKSDKQLFVSSMKHLDSAIFNYISSLSEDADLWENSLVIIVSDHGKVFGLEDLPWSEAEFFRIPLLIGGGALNEKLIGKKWNSIVSQSDLYATLSYLLTDNSFGSNKPWGRPMFNFNGFNQAMCFKGDYSLLIEGDHENLGHIQEFANSMNYIELQRKSLQSKIIRKYFR